MSNIFEIASKNKLRFSSNKGELTVEQLWDLPLQSKGGCDLDTIAKQVNAELKASGEESFVSTSANPGQARLTLQLDILKHIIASKLKQADEAKNRAERSAQRERLQAALAEQEDAELKKLTPAELRARLAELDSDKV